jgi:hypothetical protein
MHPFAFVSIHFGMAWHNDDETRLHLNASERDPLRSVRVQSHPFWDGIGQCRAGPTLRNVSNQNWHWAMSKFNVSST